MHFLLTWSVLLTLYGIFVNVGISPQFKAKHLHPEQFVATEHYCSALKNMGKKTHRPFVTPCGQLMKMTSREHPDLCIFYMPNCTFRHRAFTKLETRAELYSWPCSHRAPLCGQRTFLSHYAHFPSHPNAHQLKHIEEWSIDAGNPCKKLIGLIHQKGQFCHNGRGPRQHDFISKGRERRLLRVAAVTRQAS